MRVKRFAADPPVSGRTVVGSAQPAGSPTTRECIGDRVARLRVRRGHTQESLAAVAGVSVDVVRRPEQNQRLTARLSTLNALAGALDVETSTLIGQPTTFQRAVPDRDPSPSLPALRRAVIPVAELLDDEAAVADGESPSVHDLREALRSTEAIRREGRLSEIATIRDQMAGEYC